MNICTMGVAAGRMEGGGITSQKTGGNDPTNPLFLIQPGKKSSPGKDDPLDNRAKMTSVDLIFDVVNARSPSLHISSYFHRVAEWPRSRAVG